MKPITTIACVLVAACGQAPARKTVYYVTESPSESIKPIARGWHVGVNMDEPRIKACENRTFRSAEEASACIDNVSKRGYRYINGRWIDPVRRPNPTP
jgi:hypothetical protein